MTLPRPVPGVLVRPPIVLPDAGLSISTPRCVGDAPRSGKSVPMKSPATTLPFASSDLHAAFALPEMTLRAAAVVPPIVLPSARIDLDAVVCVGDGGGARDVGADIVALDHVARRMSGEYREHRSRRPRRRSPR